MSLLDVYVIVSQASLLLPVVSGGLYYRKMTPAFRWLFYFFVLCIGFELQATVSKKLLGNNMPGLHLFSITQFLALSVVYYQYLKDNRLWGRLIRANALIAFMIAVADAVWIDGIMRSNTVSRSYGAVSVVVYSLIYLYRVFQDDTLQHRHNPMFWFTIAGLLYFANNLLYFMLREHLLAYERSVETISFCVYLAFNIAAHCLYAHSFSCFGKWKTES